MTVRRWLGTLGCVCIFLLSGPRDSGSAKASTPSTLIFVANEHSSRVSIIRSSDNQVVSTIAVEGSPLSIGIMPDISKVYVGVAKRGISVIRTSDRKIKTTVKVGDHPVSLAITPDGSKLYSLNIKDQQAIFSVIETRQDRIVDSFNIELQCSIWLAPLGSGTPKVTFTPDGSKAYITIPSSAYMSVIQTSNNSRCALLPVGEVATRPVVNRDGSRVYVAGVSMEKGGKVSVIDTASNTIIATVPLTVIPADLTIHPKGSKLYVAGMSMEGEPRLMAVTTKRHTVVFDIRLPYPPAFLAMDPKGSNLYVVYFDEPMVSLIQTGKGKRVKNIKVGNDPVALAFTQDGSKIYIANQGSGTASVIRTSDHRVVATVKVGQSPRALGIVSIPKNASLK